MFNSPIDEIKNKIDVIDLIGSYIKLTKAGRNYKANCPFHSEKTPSFMVSAERQSWHCFGCGKGGSIFDFVMEMEGMDFAEALKVLAQRAGVELKAVNPQFAAKEKNEKTRLLEICGLASKFFIKQLQAGKTGQQMQGYLVERGLKDETIREWEIGYAPKIWDGLFKFLRRSGYLESEICRAGLAIKNENKNSYYDRFRDRIMFPLKNQNGAIVGFTGRENPYSPDPRMGKYVNSPSTLIFDKSRLLYGLDKAKMTIKEKDLCVLVEGQMDVIMVHQAGFHNAIAGSGTALTQEQLKIIKRYTSNLALAYDMDAAGETAAKRGIGLALGSELNTKVITLSSGKDPADFVKENADLWSKAVDEAQDVVQFYFSNAFSKNNSETSQGKKEISKILVPVIAEIGNKVEQDHWLDELSWRLKISKAVLAGEVQKVNKPHSTREQDNPSYQENTSRQSLEEYALGLAMSFPQALAQVKKESYTFFTNPNVKNILQEARTKKTKPAELKKNLPDELAKRFDYIIFKAEAQKDLIDDFEPEKEIQLCLNRLKCDYFKNRRAELGLAIKGAEKDKDQKRKIKLMQEFSELSKQTI